MRSEVDFAIQRPPDCSLQGIVSFFVARRFCGRNEVIAMSLISVIVVLGSFWRRQWWAERYWILCTVFEESHECVRECLLACVSPLEHESIFKNSLSVECFVEASTSTEVCCPGVREDGVFWTLSFWVFVIFLIISLIRLCLFRGDWKDGVFTRRVPRFVLTR
jgi:nitrate/nitrite transporter NarK